MEEVRVDLAAKHVMKAELMWSFQSRKKEE